MECKRNLEVMWLLGGLHPSYKTIADFRKDNLKALKQVNQDFVELCKELDLFGRELVGIDGSFFRGNVAKDRIYTEERLQRGLKHLEEDIQRYLKELDTVDEEEGKSEPKKVDIQEKLAQLRARQEKRQAKLKELKESGQTQIADVDPDARLLSKRGHTTAGYNVQIAVDERHKLIVVSDVTQDGNDEQQLAPMAQAAKAVLEVDNLDATADTGYFNVEQIKRCEENGITPYVPEPDKQAQVRKQGRFTRDEFSYDAQNNYYRCPAGKELKYSTSIHKGDKVIWVYRSSTPVCAACALKDRCLPAKTSQRIVSRWEHEEMIEAHRQRMKMEGNGKMRLRSGICEHPFGTLKQWCGWSHFFLRGLDKVRAEMDLLMLSYNFKRVLSIIGLADFRAYCSVRRLQKATISC